ncbi:hypothetical protein V2W30_22565 [Streptomyces sp. Q6]|uniref:Uncharacterized protein n=1 Tax=Streptomyces citrinus TaxID=3118173 RepID=A0ACD5AF45_9ACTN
MTQPAPDEQLPALPPRGDLPPGYEPTPTTAWSWDDYFAGHPVDE